MRKAPAVIVLGLAVPALSALPVVTAPHASARPVTPEVRAAALHGVDGAVLHAAAGRASAQVSDRAWRAGATPAAAKRTFGTAAAATDLPAVLVSRRHVAPFQLLGVTWRGSAAAPARDLTVVVRSHGKHGWSEWTALEQQDAPDGPDASGRLGTEPLWVGTSDGYQVRVDVHDGAPPAGLRVDLVAPGSSPADGSVGAGRPAASAAAAVSAPVINSRAAWGADERLRGSSPQYSSTIKEGFVHHTAGTNKYSASDVPKIIRGIYAYHTKGNGWSDIGYNFLVDRFGRLWEGRYGGVSRPVLGAHTGGFNVDSFAVSAIGNYDKAATPEPMLDSIARLLAWKLSLYYRNPNGTTTLTSQGGGTSKYPAGRKVSFNVISGHRDAGNTECPGTKLYNQLGHLRSLTAGYLGAGLVNPSVSSSSLTYSGSALTVSARTLRAQDWRLTVSEHWRGDVVRTLTGTAAPGSPVAARWDLHDAGGAAARPGLYDLALQSWDSDGTARTWRGRVTLNAPRTSPPTVAAVPLPGPTGFVPVDPARLFATTSGSRLPLGTGQRVDIAVLGVGGVPATGVGAVALSVTASYPTRSTAVAVWPAGAAKPASALMQVPAGQTRTSLTTTAVGGDGKVSVTNLRGNTELTVDVVGYFPTADPKTAEVNGGVLHPIRPDRLFDSRKDSAGILRAGDSRVLLVPDQGWVTPDRIGAVVVNVTTVGARGDGSLTVHRPGSGLTAAYSSAYAAGPANATRVVTALAPDGTFKINNRGSDTHVVVDLVGYYAPTSIPNGRTFRAVTAKRVLDTRSGLGARKAKLGVGTLTLALAGTGRPLPAGASAVVLNLTAVAATRSTVLTAWPTGYRRPGTSDLNVAPHTTTANLVVMRLGTGGSAGKLSLYNSAGTVHLVGDVIGYYR